MISGATSQALADQPLQAVKSPVRLTDTLMAGNRRGYAALPAKRQLRVPGRAHQRTYSGAS